MATTGKARERFATAMRDLYATYTDSIEHILREGQDIGELHQDVDVAAVSVMLTGAFDGAMLQYWFDRSIPVADHLDKFIDILSRGLTCETAARS